MPWIVLLIAGAFEIGFTSCLKMSSGLTKLWPSLGFLCFATLSFVLLNKATQTIPLGTAYAVWTGIGAFGTAVIGMLFFGDPISAGRIFFLSTLIGSIVGLKFVAGD